MHEIGALPRQSTQTTKKTTMVATVCRELPRTDIVMRAARSERNEKSWTSKGDRNRENLGRSPL